MAESARTPDRTRARWLGALAVALAFFAAYVGLTSELPIDDTARFTPSVAALRCEWDPAHLFMQPATVLWQRWLSFGSDALVSQHLINATSAGIALGILWMLLGELGAARVRRVALILLAGFSFDVLVLATSGHMKLTVMPFLCLGLRAAALWERDLAVGGQPSRRRLIECGAWLGVATTFLVSSVLLVPCAALAVLWARVRMKQGLRRGVREGFVLGLTAAATIVALFLATYLVVGTNQRSLAGFLEFARGSQASGRGGPTSGVLESLSRLAYGVGLAFVYLGDLGSILRAKMSGALPSLAGYSREIVWPLIAWTLIGSGLVALFVTTLLRLTRRGARGSIFGLCALAQIAGTLAFAFVWNLTEAEFYFPIVAPLTLLAVMLPRKRALDAVIIAASVLVVGTNLGSWALPRREYPLVRYGAELAKQLGPHDLLVGFQDYPGGPCLEFLLPALPGASAVEVDELTLHAPDAEAALSSLDQRIRAALQSGGRVLVLRIFDEHDWNAPWPVLRMKGIDKARLRTFVEQRWQITEHTPIAEIPTWELTTRAPR